MPRRPRRRHGRGVEQTTMAGGVRVGGLPAVYDLTTGRFEYLERVGDPADKGERRPEGHIHAGRLAHGPDNKRRSIDPETLTGKAGAMNADMRPDSDLAQGRGTRERNVRRNTKG